jgi:hypothetical protein
VFILVFFGKSYEQLSTLPTKTMLFYIFLLIIIIITFKSGSNCHHYPILQKECFTEDGIIYLFSDSQSVISDLLLTTGRLFIFSIFILYILVIKLFSQWLINEPIGSLLYLFSEPQQKLLKVIYFRLTGVPLIGLILELKKERDFARKYYKWKTSKAKIY